MKSTEGFNYIIGFEVGPVVFLHQSFCTCKLNWKVVRFTKVTGLCIILILNPF